MKRIPAMGAYAAIAGVALAASLSCGDRGRDEVSGGDVLADSAAYEALDYTLTSDRYNRWLRAQHALDSAGVTAPERLDIRRVTDADIDRVTAALEADARTRGAITSADMSVRDFVLTSVALAQSWDAVNGPAARVVGARPENLAFLREQASADAGFPARRAASIVDPGDSEVESDHDSDRDSDVGRHDRGWGRGKGKGKARGHRGRG